MEEIKKGFGLDGKFFETEEEAKAHQRFVIIVTVLEKFAGRSAAISPVKLANCWVEVSNDVKEALGE